MFDPLTFVAMYGLKSVGTYVGLHIIWKNRPNNENFRELMRITFIRCGLYVLKDNGKSKREVTPKLISFEQPEWGFVFKFRLFPGMSVSQFANKTEEIGTAFNGECSVWGEGNEVTFEIMRGEIPKEEFFNIEKIRTAAEGKAIPMPIGVTRKGVELIDFSNAPHGIVGGESGSGKSVFVRQFLSTVALLRTPEQVEMTLVDLKHGIELSIFRNLPHVVNFAHDVSDIDEVLSEVNSLIDERGALFRESGVMKIAQYNEKYPPLPYRLVVVDELAEVEDTDAIQRISRLGRAYGVHMLLATQRPDAKVIEGQIKANCPFAACFKVKNEVNSRIILDHGAAAKLPPVPGRCIIQYAGERQAQTFYLPEDAARGLLKPLEIKREPARGSGVLALATSGTRNNDATVYF